MTHPAEAHTAREGLMKARSQGQLDRHRVARRNEETVRKLRPPDLTLADDDALRDDATQAYIEGVNDLREAVGDPPLTDAEKELISDAYDDAWADAWFWASERMATIANKAWRAHIKTALELAGGLPEETTN